jgi:eukaryotic-like serine/threonine-protein kinase
MGGPSSPGSNNSSTGARTKESDKQQQGTFFLGRYRVVDEIGVGGMASVHLARMDGPGGFQKWVAIKRIHPHLVEDDQFVDMFLDEARIAAGINHANVAQVFDLGKDDNTYWIAMEYLHGEPLREVMRRAEERRVRISPELAARICSDAAEGLHAAHELRGKNGQLLGLVHRDVTPHNLFLTYDGYTKVVDFGIAKVADRLSSTRAGTLKGKLAYMSPEQVRGVEVDRTTDIFALGVVLWELTTNQRLFRMDTDLDTLEKVQACVVPPPSSIVADYPIELESVVMKALAKHKEERFQTAREFSRALQNFLMRRGAFVGSEDVAQFVTQVFADRIQKREAHLAWAAEVTSTINVDQMRGMNPEGAALLNLGQEPEPEPERGARPNNAPASGVAPVGRPLPEAQMTVSSLMDDDEDVPTTVATRDHIEQVRQQQALERPMMRPAAGVGPQPAQMGAQSPGMAVQPGIPMGRGGALMGQQYASPGVQGGYGPPPNAQYQGNQFGPPEGPMDERSLPYGSSSDLNNTLALPHPGPKLVVQGADEPARHGQGAGPPPAGGMHQPGYHGGGYAPYNGQGYPPPPAFAGQNVSPGFAPPPVPLGSSPSQSFVLPMSAQPPQSQIETALSLPRPDPAAIWYAKQDAAQRGQRRNIGVLIAVIAITALCVIGICALVYFKTQGPQVPGSPPAATEAPAHGAGALVQTGAAAAEPVAHGHDEPLAAGSAAARAASATGASALPASAKPGSVSSTAALAASGSDAKDAWGYLTILCSPVCDEVLDGNKALGPSPLNQVPVKPGPHRITAKRGAEKRTANMTVQPGQTVTQRFAMTK